MLLGRASPQVSQGPFRETRNPRKRVEFVQKIVDSFWRHWTRDVFPLLVPRKKWNTSRRNVQVDDFVMVAEPNTVRGKWIIERMIHVHPGQDGRVRNIKVKILTSKRMKKHSPSSGQRKCYRDKTLLTIDNDRKQFD